MSFDRACRSLMRCNRDFPRLRDRHGKLDFQPQHLRSPFESLVRAIAHQQLHRNAAEAILGRLIAKFDAKAFPSPADLVALKDTEFRTCGFSAAKTKSLKDIAAKTLSGVVPSAREIVHLPDDEIVARLTEIYGVGRWTVEMLLIFQLGRMDVWPIDDFGIKKGYQVFKRRSLMPVKKQLETYGKLWHPYRTVLSLYLWKEADLHKRKTAVKGKVQS